MKTYEFVTLIAILVGPILAVAVQLLSQNQKQIRDQQIFTFRNMMASRHLPSDPTYSTAINMIPVDFNGAKKVMAAHKAHIDAILFQPIPTDVEKHVAQMISKQTKLLFEMAKHLKYDLPETDIQSGAYAARGFVERDNIMLDGFRAWPRIARALEMSVGLDPNADGPSQ